MYHFSISPDQLNRILTKEFGDAETTWAYDSACSFGIGRLCKVRREDGEVPTSETSYGYDAMGRIASSRQLTGAGEPFGFTYTYNEGGGLKSMEYPSGRVVSYTLDALNRVTHAGGSYQGATPTYAANIAYSPHGAPTRMDVAGKVQQWCYNNRMQLTAARMGLSASTGTDCEATTDELLRLEFVYPAGANNGNLASQRMTFPAIGGAPALDLTQAYAYDPLNRIERVQEGAESRDFRYDPYGNMWVPTTSAGFARQSFTPATSAWFDNKNRLTNPALGVQRDSAGNLTAIGGFEYEYDAEGMMTKATPSMGNATVYRYDGDGRRVAKQTGTGPVTTYVYNAFGELAAESQTGGPPPEQPVGTHYLIADHLGSTRLVTDATGTVVSRHDYLPFGEEISADVGGRTTAMKYALNDDLTQRFTGKERDEETELDYFGARYFSGVQGRWTSPDWSEIPEAIPYADVANPQSLNLYLYGRNNPLLYRDLDGHCTVDGEEHGWLWCVGHAVGLTMTEKEKERYRAYTAERERQYREWEEEVKAKGEPVMLRAEIPINLGLGRIAAMRGARGGIEPVLKGRLGVDKAVSQIEAEGGQILGREITIENSAGRARVDIVYRDATGNVQLALGEAKNGPTAGLNPNQRSVYNAVATEGAKFVGGNAAKAGLPATIAPGSVRIFKY